MLAAVRAGSAVLRLGLWLRNHFALVLTTAFVGLIDFASGGYFAASWGWVSAPLLWILVVALVGGASVRLQTLEWIWLLALGGLVGWSLLSSFWSLTPSDSFLEAERSLLYVAVGVAVLVLARNVSPALAAVALLAVLDAVLVYALCLHLLPNVLRPYDPYAWQLADPIGYSDGLGLVATTALLFAIGISARADARFSRAFAAASAPPAAAVLYFSFSRSAWLALAIAAVAATVVDRHRLELLVGAAPAAACSAAMIVLCTQAPALRHRLVPLADAAREGHVLAIGLVLLAAASAVLQLLLQRRRTDLVARAARLASPPPRVAIVGALAAACVALALSGARPWSLVAHGYRGFAAPPPAAGSDLQHRLFSLSGNLRGRYWSVAWDDVRANPFLGSGAGTFGTYWLTHRPLRTPVRDAHNLYLETLAELGPLGLALLLVTVGIPLAATWKARAHPLTSTLAGGFIAYLVHAALQWDWELPGLTAAAVVIAAVLLVSASDRQRVDASRSVRSALVLGAAAAASFASVCLIGNAAVAAASRAADHGAWTEASGQAAKAARWTPWSADAWRLRAQAQLARGEQLHARSSIEHALSQAPNDPTLWLELARLRHGAARTAAAARADELDPLDAVATSRVTAWSTYGSSVGRGGFAAVAPRPSDLKLEWVRQLDGAITGQPLVAPNVPHPGDGAVYVGTAHGTVYELDQTGNLVARRSLGRLRLPGCAYLPGGEYGVTGTPVIDRRTATLYAVDGRGLLHALALGNLAERPGWPVKVVSDPRSEHVWGALNLVGGRIILGTGLLCRRASGHLVEVDLATRGIRRFTVVPFPHRGGGIWGWGGVTYDRASRSLLALTGDALPPPSASGRPFDEATAFAEHLVKLRLSLGVVAADAPVHYSSYRDSDFTGSPIVLRGPACPPLVAGENKNGRLYVWRLDDVAAGPVWSRRLAARLNGQPAWSPSTRSLYVVGERRLFRLALTPDCRLRTRWSVRLSGAAVNGPPMVSGNVVWFAVSSAQALWAVDATTGRILRRLHLREAAFAPPAPTAHGLYVGAFRGLFFSYAVR